MQKITPFLWFDDQAEQAARFYVSLFKNSKITNISYYGENAPRPAGMAFMVNFVLDGEEFMALNGGPEFKFSEAISLYVDCESQAEVDHLWARLTEGGQEIQCGWLRDRFGLVWQIVPSGMTDYINGKDAAAAQRAMQVMLQMKKLDLDQIRRAYENR
jgi:predicted 3-demethylubiquinone-9 3-methyltransferase (glyoxalase superfamily)